MESRGRQTSPPSPGELRRTQAVRYRVRDPITEPAQTRVDSFAKSENLHPYLDLLPPEPVHRSPRRGPKRATQPCINQPSPASAPNAAYREPIGEPVKESGDLVRVVRP